MARRRQPEVRAASPLPVPASKRLKTSTTSHVPAQTGLAFLVDEDARKGKKLEGKLTNGVPSTKATRVDESHAVVAPDTKHQNYADEGGSSADEATGSLSGEEDSDSEESDDDDDEIERLSTTAKARRSPEKTLLNGHVSDGKDGQDGDNEDAVLGAEDVEMHDQQPDEDEEIDTAEYEEPSFGEMLQARHPDPIDVHTSLPNPMADRQALIPVSDQRAITAPSGTSLGTVLTQALKTNDKDLLESCFHTTDLPSIRSTIQRLQSQHVATLLQRLAERIYKRPGRAGSLLVWVQWSLIAHGGYFATQPDVMKKLKALSQVIRERASGLQPLLHLKGKLDMLSAQLELRRNIQAASRAAYGGEDEEDEEGVVYVEGQGDEWSDSEEGDEEDVGSGERPTEPVPGVKPKLHTAMPNTDRDLSDSDDESDSDDDMPNGVVQEGDDASSEEDEEDEDEGLFDVEAEETSDDNEEGNDDDESDDEADSIPDSDAESEPSDGESEASGVKPPLPNTLNRKR